MNRSFRTLAVEGLHRQSVGATITALLLTLLLIPTVLLIEAGPGGVLGLPVGTTLLLAAGAGVGIALLAVDDRLWVLSALLSLAVFIFREEEGKLGVDVLFFATYTVLGTILWILKEIVIGQTHLIRSRFDVLFVGTLALCIVTSFVASLVHDVESRLMIREYLSFLLLLFYFPVRSALARPEDLRRLLYVGLFLGAINGVINLLTYQEKVVATAMTFGAVNARSAMNESLSVVLFCICFAIVVGARTFRVRLLGLAGLSLFAGLLILSLSRGPIVATAVGSVTVLLLMYRRRALRVLAYALVALVVNVGLVFLALPDFAESIFENIEGRFETVERIGSDVSFGSRFAESEAIWSNYIPASPVIGHGFGVPYSFFDPVFEATSRPYYTHNGYLHAFFKFGIPLGASLLLLVLFSPMARFPYAGVRRLDYRTRLVLAGALASQIALTLMNLTSNVLTYYMELMLLATLLGLFDQIYAGRYHVKDDRVARFAKGGVE